MAKGCCWIEADVILLGQIKGCISPGVQNDDSDFCQQLKDNEVPNISQVTFCMCSNGKFWFALIAGILCCCGCLCAAGYCCVRCMRRPRERPVLRTVI